MHRVRNIVPASIFITGAACLSLAAPARADWPSLPSRPSLPSPRSLPNPFSGGSSGDSSRTETAATATTGAAPIAVPVSLPPFCGRKFGGTRLEELNDSFNDHKKHDLDLFIAVNRTLCDPEAKPDARQAAGSMRAALIKEFGLSNADLNELPAVLSRTHQDGIVGFDRDLSSYGYGQRNDALAAPPLSQGSLLVQAFRYHPQKGFWIADSLGDKLSASAKLFLVHTCFKEHVKNRQNDPVLAACLDDMRTIDRAAIFREADAAKIRPDEKLGLKIFATEVMNHRAEIEKSVAERVQKDPAYKTIFVEIPGQVKKEWDAMAREHGDLLALTRTLEFASIGDSRRASQGCEQQVAPHMQKLIKGFKLPKDPHEMPDLSETPLGFVTVSAAHACALGSDGEWAGFAAPLGADLAAGMWLRGPRLSTIEAIFQRAGTLKFDERSKDLTSEIPRDGNRALDAFKTFGDTSGSSGVVAKADASGDKLAVSFRAEEMEQYECLNRVKTERWSYDSTTKTFGPVMACTKYKTLKVKLNPTPAVTLPSSLGAGIAPGRFMYFVTRGSAVPTHVWDSAKRSKLIALYGVQL